MPDPVNPYAAPHIDNAPADRGRDVSIQGTAVMQGNLLLIPIGSSLPDVCLFTGRRGTGCYIDKTLTWASPFVYLGLLLHIIVVLILYFILRKQGRLKWYIDDTVVARKKRATNICWGLFAGMIAGTVFGIMFHLTAMFVVVPLLALALLVVAVVMVPQLRIARIDKDYIYLKKVHPDAIEAILSA